MTIENDQDWANLGKYKKDNEELKKSSSGEDRTVFIGDSITEGWSDFSPEFFQQNNFVNRGISGQTTPQMLIRLKPDAVRLDPKMIVINAGTNDIAGNTGPSTSEMIIDNICSMAEIAIKNNIDIALSTILPVYKYPGNDEVVDPPKIISVINAALEEYCKKNSLIYIDYYSSMVDKKKGLKSEYGNDGVHPTKEGYDVMEKVVKNVISGTV